MEKFIELIEQIHKERFDAVMNKIVAEKIPVAFFSIASLENAVEVVKNLRAQNLNVATLLNPIPPPLDTLKI